MKRLVQARERLRATRAVATVAGSAAVLVLGATSAMGAGADTGFVQPYAGTPRYERYAPTEAPSSSLVNRPLGQGQANRIARKLGLDKERVFTDEQYRLFISGQGSGGDPELASLVDRSVSIFTNTTGRPLLADVNGTPTPTVLASYGLFVNTHAQLMSLANSAAPTRKVNAVLTPVTGYLDTWCRANGCRDSVRMLRESAYLSEVIYANESQEQGGVAELVPNEKRGRETTVGMSMAPSIWIVNFVLLYVLKPEVAAKMPAWWTPIPDDVVQALEASPDGQVSYGDYASSFPD